MWQQYVVYSLLLLLIVGGFLASARRPSALAVLLRYALALSLAVTALLAITGFLRLTQDTRGTAYGIHYFLAHTLVVLVVVEALISLGAIIQQSLASRRYVGVLAGIIPLLSLSLVLFGTFTGYLLSGQDDPPPPSTLRFYVLHAGLAPLGISSLLCLSWFCLRPPRRSFHSASGG